MERTRSNELVVRKYMYDYCKDHGVLARHIASNLELALGLFFIPTKEEVVGLAIARTQIAQRRKDAIEQLRDPIPDDAL